VAWIGNRSAEWHEEVRGGMAEGGETFYCRGLQKIQQCLAVILFDQLSVKLRE